MYNLNRKDKNRQENKMKTRVYFKYSILFLQDGRFIVSNLFPICI